VVLNASATWPAKAWPLPHFAVLARSLRDSVGARVWVAWGPGEEKDRDTLLQLGEGALRAMPPTDLPTLAAWLGAVDLLVTTDSGPKHIGVGEGTPTLTLFGSTDPQGWQPATGPHRGIHHDVPCRPCNRLECNVPGHPCLDELLPERVAVLAREMLQSGAAT
jgi:heptosyltransferase-2